MWYVTKRGGSPYSGPSLERAGIVGSFYFTMEEAIKVANILAKYNPAGFSVETLEETHPGFVPDNQRGYPFLIAL